MKRRGFVLVVVVFFTVLLFSGIATFLRRSTLDAAIVRNRDFAARAEALARGGVRLAIVLLQQDLLEEQAQRSPAAETRSDLWAQADQLEVATEDGGTLRLHVEDVAARIPLNALVPADGTGEDAGASETSDPGRLQEFLAIFLEKVIAEMPGRPEQKPYDPRELAANLIDWLDADDVTPRGEPEDAWYQQQDPPYRTPPEHALLSVDELALVRGFDAPLVEALRPYVSAFPLAGGGVNPNTAATWVLASLEIGGPLGARLADEDFVKRIAKCREQGPICEGCGQTLADCGLEVGANPIPSFAFKSDVFRIEARAEYGDVRRAVEAVVSRRDPASPEILAWRVR
jgi:type II secretory pathway component PulK